jgi:hypothetical protein
VPRIEGGNGLLAILFPGGDVGRVSIEDTALDLVFEENHDTNLERLFRDDDAPADGSTPRPRRAALRMQLDIEDTIVRVTAPWTIESWVSDPITIHATLGPSPFGLPTSRM